VRDVAKWIASSFGAAGAILIGTAPLSGLGRIDPSPGSVALLALSGGAALSGLGVIVWKATDVLVPSTRAESVMDPPPIKGRDTVADLRREITAHPDQYMSTWAETTDEFVRIRQSWFAAQRNIDAAVRHKAYPVDVLKTLLRERELIVENVEALSRVTSRLRALSRFYDTASRFRVMRVWVFGAAVLTVLGITGFLAVVGASTPDDANNGDTTTSSASAPLLRELTVGSHSPLESARQ
jgi:hypothetical protein